mmetsp:Transcript_111063/g.308757  ORF Transcript_111063/g.308757 Transcript_111063/m.308757 type:complete len:288 (+) Transcript_111063:261-1124(+)
MAEEVGQDLLLQHLDTAERVDVALHPVGALRELGDLVQREDQRAEEPRNLDVLVNEHQGVRDVVVAQVDGARPDPSSDFPLHLREDLLHRDDAPGRLLHALQPLPRVRQGVGVLLVQKVLLRQVPQLEHVVQHLSPQRHRLQHEGVLALVRVREPSAFHTLCDGEGKLRRARLDRIEVLLQQGDEPVARRAVEPQVGAVVAQRVDALLHEVLCELFAALLLVVGVGVRVARPQEAEGVRAEPVVLPAPGHGAVGLGEVLDGGLLRLDLALDLDAALALRHDLHGRDA